MIEAVRGYDPRAAAGILSGLALRLERASNLAAPPSKTAIEERILTELREALNLDPEDESFETVERLADALDQEAERVAGIEPDPTITEKLSRDGLLPSDTLDLEFDAGLEKHHSSHWPIERQLAEITIRQPHREQAFTREEANSGVSIFARFFSHKFPVRSFWLLVTGVRAGSILHIGQVFRVYPHDVDLSGCETLTDVLKEFANKFGVEVELNGRRGKFFMSVIPQGSGSVNDHIKLPTSFKGLLVISGLHTVDEKQSGVHLVFVINLTAYFQSVNAKHGWDEGILKELKRDGLRD